LSARDLRFAPYPRLRQVARFVSERRGVNATAYYVCRIHRLVST
jgi:hypothetical protein